MGESAVSRGTQRARPLRKDAARNRELILQTARKVFAERGLDVMLDDIAREAGVGVATLYRRFPDREALIEALFEDQLEKLVAIASAAARHADPWQGFREVLIRFTDVMTSDRGVREVMMSGAHGLDRLAKIRASFLPLMEVIVVRAQTAGRLRTDVRATDLPLIELMLGAAASYTRTVREGLHQRYLALFLDGLQARPGLDPLTAEALSPDELAAAMSGPLR